MGTGDRPPTADPTFTALSEVNVRYREKMHADRHVHIRASELVATL